MERFNNYLNSLDSNSEIKEEVFEQFVFGQSPVVENLCQNVLYKLREALSANRESGSSAQKQT